tara:strand:- start:117 stop:620 length:504 start_codon:yes stop_codon:yes gene_type:complete
MIGLCHTLLNQLRQKALIYDELIILLEEEWGDISEYSYDKVQSGLNKKETMILKMQVLEENRLEVVEALAKQLGLSIQDLTLKKLIASINHPMRVKLMEVRNMLLGQLQKIAFLNAQNQGLVDASSLSIKKSLAFLHKTQDMNEAAYHADGNLIGSKSEIRMLSTEV